MITDLANKRRELAEGEANVAALRTHLTNCEGRRDEAQAVWAEAEAIRRRAEAAVVEAMTAPGAVTGGGLQVPGRTEPGAVDAPWRFEQAKKAYTRAEEDAGAANREVLRWESIVYETKRTLGGGEQYLQRLSGEIAGLEAQRAAALAPPAPQGPPPSLLAAFQARLAARSGGGG